MTQISTSMQIRRLSYQSVRQATDSLVPVITQIMEDTSGKLTEVQATIEKCGLPAVAYLATVDEAVVVLVYTEEQKFLVDLICKDE